MAGQNNSGSKLIAIYGVPMLTIVGAAFAMGVMQGESSGADRAIDRRFDALEANQLRLENEVDELDDRAQKNRSDIRELQWLFDVNHGRTK